MAIIPQEEFDKLIDAIRCDPTSKDRVVWKQKGSVFIKATIDNVTIGYLEVMIQGREWRVYVRNKLILARDGSSKYYHSLIEAENRLIKEFFKKTKKA